MSRCPCGATGNLPYQNLCHACDLAQRRDQRHANPLPELLRGRKWQYDNWYHITPEQREAAAVAQNRCCRICNKPEDQSAFGLFRLQVEHCHECGAFRGLVCNTCNGRIKRHELGQHVPADLVATLNDYIGKNCQLNCRVRRDVGLRARKTRRPSKRPAVMP